MSNHLGWDYLTLPTNSAKLIVKHGVKYSMGLAYHPQTNGQVEKTNREIKNIMEKTVTQVGKTCSV